MREIATLQIGAYANFVGAHFWNFQDELLGLAADHEADPVFQRSGLDMDVLYRTGETRQGVATYTPRLVAIDLRGSLGAVRSSGSLYDEGQGVLHGTQLHTWTGPVSLHKEEPPEKSEFLKRLEAEEAGQQSNATDETIVQGLDERVQSWTDYSKVQLHPRSVYEIEGVWNTVTPFDSFCHGKGLFTQSFRLEEFQERFRFVVEECDHLQGVQALVDDSGGFSGVASDILTNFEDEYGGIPFMLFTVRPPEEEPRPVVRSLHDAFSFASLSSIGDIVVPLGLPQLSRSAFARHLTIDDAKVFQTSAVYAGALHNATLPFRMLASSTQAGGCDMGVLVKGLTYATRNVANLSAALPSGMSSVFKKDLREPLVFFLSVSLTPEVALASSQDYAAESYVIQGARLAGSKGLATVTDVMKSINYEKQKFSSHVACSPCPLPVPLPFPSIFRSSVGRYGDIILETSPSSATGRGALDVFSVPVATSLRTDKGIEPYLRRRLSDIEQLGLKRQSPVLQGWDLAREDVEELREVLANTLARYADETEFDSS
ncbi:hypothetical protein SELMODRAFT_79429 [Selaginella moellendorffii]|uniref:Misato Segment II tubulin-like domain-containing protein n=1 Tax=Selaginella moellendorffii TaxID=88036 RepID=D8QWG6_SELML|nr:hypothetical protein SELMODRAFT_79429 [Selaginella moellendorffii]